MSRIIDHTNYEAWLLDFIEGNLNETEENVLLAFLKENPELCSEVEDITPFALKSEKTAIYPHKNKLKKANYTQDMLIASIEGCITESEAKELDELCKSDSSVAHELKWYEKTVLQCDNSITYSKKSALKKKTFFVQPAYILAAAVILLLAVFMYTFQNYSGFSKYETIQLKNRTAKLNTIPIREAIEVLNNSENYMATNRSNTNFTQSESIKAVPENILSYDRVAIAKLPVNNIEQIAVSGAPVQMGYCSEMLHAVADYGERNSFSLNQLFDKNNRMDKIAAFTEKNKLSSPIKLLRKTKEDLLSQDYIAEIRNLKNNE